TGSGKSELLARLILDDIHAHRGVVVVDPKGDLINDVLARIPLDATGRVILVDPDTPGPPPVLNPLTGDDSAATVDNLVSIFSRVYAASWGPRTDDLLRSALLTLRLISDTPTLADVPALLTDATFRDEALPKIDDEILRGFWTWYDGLSDASRAQVAAPLMNKLRGLLLRPFVRNTLTGGESTINMDTILDGGVLLARLAKGNLSTDTVHLMGSLIVAQTWQAATRRSQLPHHQRKDASLYLDEFQNFMNLAYPADQMLAESRAYKLSLTLAHHYLGQLRRDLIDGVTTNARNKIIFNANPDDARQLAHHTTPYLTDHDLAHLPRYHIAARLIVNNQDTHAFTAVTQKLPPPIVGRADHIRNTRAHTGPPHSNPSTTKHIFDPRRAA
ncbi:type IV secretory system conjugative DNA transfer family protein, partial [Kibdelosporangium lantanae]